MRVLVDTTVWSLALRRRRRALGASDLDVVRELEALIVDGRTILVGPVRQRGLTGVRDPEAGERLRRHLRYFEDERLSTEDFESAAEFADRCLAAGVMGSPTDLLLCAVADRRGAAVFTADDDFPRYAKVVPVRLHSPRRRRTA